MIIKIDDIKKKEIREKIIEKIKFGNLFVYPTDTIYGIGCDATNIKAVKKLRGLKKSTKPFSVIASKEWIRKNCFVDKKARYFLKKLPGPYTFILKLKNKNVICKEVNLGDNIGVRIPKHKFTKLILESGRPFITTSCNISGEDYATSIEEIPKIFKKNAIIINAGILKRRPSRIISLIGKTRIIRK